MKSAAPACRRELPDGIIALEIRVRTRVDFDVLVCEGAVTHAVVARFEVAGTDVASQLSRVQTWVRDDGAPLAKQDGGCGDCLGGSYGRRAVLCGRFAGPRVHPGYHEQSAETIDFGPYHVIDADTKRVQASPFDEKAQAGQKIFEREGCPMCHTPPLYTSNMLRLAQGFEPPEDVPPTLGILRISVGTDPGLALRTRKGTGYYEAPSLKGVWYRRPLSA